MTAKVLQSGSHIARFDAIKKDKGVFEAQVFVRLAREPEVAETFIPVGLYGSIQEALDNARQRAERALSEGEF